MQVQNIPKKHKSCLANDHFSGGSVLSSLLGSQHDGIKNLSITALVEKSDQANIFASSRVFLIVYNSYDEMVLRNIASKHNIVVNTTDTHLKLLVEALLVGLQDGNRVIGRAVHYIHRAHSFSCMRNKLTKGRLPVHVSRRRSMEKVNMARQRRLVPLEEMTPMLSTL